MITDNKILILAEIYAQALFELSEKANSVDAVMGDIEVLCQVHGQSGDFQTAITAPFFYEEHKKVLLSKMFGGKFNSLTLNWLMVAAQHSRLRFLSQFCEAYRKLWEERHAIERVKVTVAKPLTPAETEKIAKQIAEKLNREVVLEVRVKPDIIGGIEIRYDDKVIDNTVKTRLQLTVKSITRRGRTNEI